MPSQIINFYNKQENGIFITGASGFVGLVLIEKILRCFSSVTLYLLIRSKYKKDAASRWEDLKKHSVFSKLLEEKGEGVFDNIVVVSGDVGEDGLGLSDADKAKIVANVNIVFHGAATLDFDADLLSNVNINLQGTKRVLELCGQLRNCLGFLHVSSAYVNSDRPEVDEKLYPPPDDADRIVEITKSLDQASINIITKKIIKDHPNSYTFTKNLAEHEVYKKNQQFPTAIIRPSMILGSWKEPIPGWTDSKNGPQGFIMGAAKGVVRRLPVNEYLVYDYIPVDVVVNYMLAALWQASITWSTGSITPVFHVTTGTSKPFKWHTVSSKVHYYLHKYPLKSAVWYPNLKFLPNLQRYRISAFIFHMIPAFFLDLLTRAFGGKPILVRLHSKVNRSLNQLEKFIFNEWKFYNPKALRLATQLNEEDKQLFYLDLSTLEWEPYFHDLCIGVRTYLNKEKLSTLRAARIKDKVLYFLNLLVQSGVVFLLWWLGTFFLCPWISAAAVVILVVVTFLYL